MKSIYRLGNSWLECIRCKQKIKDMSDLSAHLRERHNFLLVWDGKAKYDKRYSMIDLDKLEKVNVISYSYED